MLPYRLLCRPHPPLCRLLCARAGSLHAAAEAARNDLLKADWIETNDKLDNLVDRATSIISQFRTSTDRTDAGVTYDLMRDLHVTKEAAIITDAYADYVEVVMRKHEDMLGPLGSM